MEANEILIRHKDTGRPIDRFSLFRASYTEQWTAWTGDTFIEKTIARRREYTDGSYINKREWLDYDIEVSEARQV